MGILNWLGLDDDDDDSSLIEVSNDRGDHIVIEVPTDKAWEVTKQLRKAGVEQDIDEAQHSRHYKAEDRIKGRDPEQYRSRSRPVVDESEDLEDSHDAEAEPWWGGFW